jgi:hypothetical protein
MKVIDPGHSYLLSNIPPDTKTTYPPVLKGQIIEFVKRFRGDDNHEGTLNQELLRVLIDRVKFLDKEVPWEGNKEILYHLRMALVLHESRALFRKVEKGDLLPEEVVISNDGHFKLEI